MQTATVHTVQRWQDFTSVEQRHPRHLNSCLFLHWEAAYTSALLLPFTKVYKDPESLLTSEKRQKVERLFFKVERGSGVSQLVPCDLFRKEQGSVGDISLCHTLSLSLILCVNFPSSLNLFLFLWLNQGVMTLWQLHKKGPFWSWNVGFLSRGAEWGVFVWNESMRVSLRVRLCAYVSL